MEAEQVTGQVDNQAAQDSRVHKIAIAIAVTLVLGALLDKTEGFNPYQAALRAAQDEIAQCREDQQLMWLTPEAAKAKGVRCDQLEAEFNVRFQ